LGAQGQIYALTELVAAYAAVLTPAEPEVPVAVQPLSPDEEQEQAWLRLKGLENINEANAGVARPTRDWPA
jgi:hypothetical protein